VKAQADIRPQELAGVKNGRLGEGLEQQQLAGSHISTALLTGICTPRVHAPNGKGRRGHLASSVRPAGCLIPTR
jgi:hypothetical protein